MIRKTLEKSRKATFAILLPNAQMDGMAAPVGTGFFVSQDGIFVTAAHVVSNNSSLRTDLDQMILKKETDTVGKAPIIIMKGIKIVELIPELDIAIFKVDFELNKNLAWLEKLSEFPYLEISTSSLDIAEPVYSFGYPLSKAEVQDRGTVKIGTVNLSPRVTSAIVSSNIEETKMVMTATDSKKYVLDKALNYGNSGGPIISTESGKVHAFCSRFQPVFVPQNHIPQKNGNPLPIMIPSLYGIVISLNNKKIIQCLSKQGVKMSSN